MRWLRPSARESVGVAGVGWLARFCAHGFKVCEVDEPAAPIAFTAKTAVAISATSSTATRILRIGAPLWVPARPVVRRRCSDSRRLRYEAGSADRTLAAARRSQHVGARQ